MEKEYYNPSEFEFFSECSEGTLEEIVLEYAQIQTEFFYRDFDSFCQKFYHYIVSHGERLREGVNFKIPLTDEYTLYISSEDKHISMFQIGNKSIDR